MYAFVCDCVERGDESSPDLPDDEIFNEDSPIRYIAGAMDNVLGSDDDEDVSSRTIAVHTALSEASEALDSDAVRRFYSCLVSGRTIVYIDTLIPILTQDTQLNVVNALTLARWLTLCAPDREAVKFGIAVWGLAKGEQERDVFLTLAQHEEFTVYAMVALSYLVPDGEHGRLWFAMARRVHGWGKIRLVERLTATQDPEIRDWLLRDGYKNDIMYEYLAYTCAVGGGLIDALRAATITDDILINAAELLQAMASDGPGRDLRDYDDSAEAVRLFLGSVMFSQPRFLECFLAVERIASYMRNEAADWKSFPQGWGESFRRKMTEMALRIVARPEWRSAIDQGLLAEDDALFWRASRAADILEIDIWPIRFERLRQGNQTQWFFVSQTDDPTRMDQVLALAEETLRPLYDDESNLAASMEMGFVMQGLEFFPGKGWSLVKDSLRHPVVHCRTAALRVLEQWGRSFWTEEMHQCLEVALFQEQDEDLHEAMHSVLLGRPLE